jgi:excisionase family DNA binding protein
MKKLTNPTPSPLLGQQSVSTNRADFLTVADWASRLKVSKRTIFRMIDEKVIPPYDISLGKTRRWHEDTYRRWIDANVEGN